MQTISKLYRALLCNGTICACVLDTKNIIFEAQRRHNTSPLSTAVLGETMTLCAYFASWLKRDKSALSLSIDGRGAGGRISVTSDGNLNLSGNIENADAALPLLPDGELDLAACVGDTGSFTIVRADGGMPTSGTSELYSGILGEEFESYFLSSEQRLAAAVLSEKITGNEIQSAGGILLEALPGAEKEDFLRLKSLLPDRKTLAKLLEEGADKILKALFGAQDVIEREINFRCRCTKDKASLAVRSLGEADARALIAECGTIIVRCPDCNHAYEFDEEDITELFSNNG